MSSAFPRPIEQLIPEAERLSRELGRLPSQNHLKAALRIRSERAKKVLQALESAGFDPSSPPDPVAPMPRVLHPVPNTEPHREAPQANPEPLGRDTVSAPVPDQAPGGLEPDLSSLDRYDAEPGPSPRPVRRWPIILLAAPAFVAIWSGWVGVGELAGFGPVRPLPGIADGFTINSAITLPIGMEIYAAYALRVWLGDGSSARARRFAKRSAIAAFILGGLGQIAYHLMTAAHLTAAPWPITTAVACLPVVVLGFGAALAHLQRPGSDKAGEVSR